MVFSVAPTSIGHGVVLDVGLPFVVVQRPANATTPLADFLHRKNPAFFHSAFIFNSGPIFAGLPFFDVDFGLRVWRSLIPVQVPMIMVDSETGIRAIQIVCKVRELRKVNKTYPPLAIERGRDRSASIDSTPPIAALAHTRNRSDA